MRRRNQGDRPPIDSVATSLLLRNEVQHRAREGAPFGGRQGAVVRAIRGVVGDLNQRSRSGLGARRVKATPRNKEQLKATRHDGIDGQGKWLAQVLRGWMAYYAVPMSGSAISAFRHHMIERWHGALMRRSQRRRLTWTRMKTIADRYLPFPRILHPWPEKRFLVTIQGGSPVR
jgi:Group II intron, maturase-specific domain